MAQNNLNLKFVKTAIVITAVFALNSCKSPILKHKDTEALKENQEFTKAVTIVEVPVDPSFQNSVGSTQGTVADQNKNATPVNLKEDVKQKSSKNKKPGKNKDENKKDNMVVGLPGPPSTEKFVPRQPEVESSEGFKGRRPIVDPFRVGEKVVHSVNYFKMSAGTMTIETRPYAMVNGVKNYQFRTSIKTGSFFSSFYTVDDYVDVLMDFEQMVPSVFTLHVKESAQLKEAQMLFDHSKKTATYWEKKVTEKNGEENKKLHWEIYPYAQNVFSAAFYMRVFKWEVGKENAFYVADDEKNLTFRAKAIRKERISTDVGDFDAIVIRPEIELKGKYNPVGDNYIWLSDDDRKLILRIESKIKIGTLVSEIIELNPGLPN